MPSLAALSASKKSSHSTPIQMDAGLPNCRNYWRLGGTDPHLPSSPSSPPPDRPPSYLLKPHLIASATPDSDDCDNPGKNPNSKYYKLRHGLTPCQFSPLNDDLIGYPHPHRVRLPFDPSPFRGKTRFIFWIIFLSILVLLTVLITSLLSIEDVHNAKHHLQRLSGGYSDNPDNLSYHHDNHHHHQLGQKLISSLEKRRKDSLKDSVLFKALSPNHHQRYH